jgi:hypothetical protein
MTRDEYQEIKRALDGLESINKTTAQMLADMWIHLDDMRKRNGLQYDDGEDQS